ncbi:MAG: tellurite resistance TerB family protein [Anderseniella sp.]
MFDPQKLLDQFMGSNAQNQDQNSGAPARASGGIPDAFKGFGGGLAAGGLAGLLLGTKKGRKMAGSAAKIGGVAVLGGLAYKAYNDWQASKASGPAGPASTGPASQSPMKNVTPEAEGTAFLPAPEADRNALGVKIIQAMIAAAKADGHIDAQEQQRIFGKFDEAGLGMEEKAFLMDELRKPLDIDGIVALADNTEQAVEIYAASCLAIDPDDPAEQAYLAMLSARLKLAPELKANIEAEVAKLAV